MSKLIHLELSNKILAAAFTVHSILGPGLLESCYEGAMVVELEKAGIPCQRQRVFPLRYKGTMVGDYIADLVVDNTVILELKSVKMLNAVMAAQIVSYLKISGCAVGYLINFNALIVQWKRFVNHKREWSRFFSKDCVSADTIFMLLLFYCVNLFLLQCGIGFILRL